MVSREKALKQLKELNKYKGKLRLAADGWNSEFKTLIATLLSARTRDEKTIEVAKHLYRKYQNAKKLANADLRDIQRIIRPVNFYKNKAKNIIQCSKQII